ncbi:MAG: 4-oxalocrotonate tautomerase [Alphaproteobacteria bacterium]|jgi:4-oxalocrotonate tautomerase|nr:4-oxalocrotonate tautomerase [Alphaproteobacteria bacterium]MBT7943320.1 4-oxalocrotonate tautomerase [Alphaproteobacteria bacterium]
MPFINIAVTNGPLSTAQKRRLFEETTRLMAEVLHKNPSLTAVRIDEHGSENWAIAGEALGAQTGVHMDIKVTDATNTDTEKAEMIERAMAMLTEVVGAVPEASYIVIHDLDAGAWGYNGKTQRDRAQARAA